MICLLLFLPAVAGANPNGSVGLDTQGNLHLNSPSNHVIVNGVNLSDVFVRLQEAERGLLILGPAAPNGTTDINSTTFTNTTPATTPATTTETPTFAQFSKLIHYTTAGTYQQTFANLAGPTTIYLEVGGAGGGGGSARGGNAGSGGSSLVTMNNIRLIEAAGGLLGGAGSSTRVGPAHSGGFGQVCLVGRGSPGGIGGITTRDNTGQNGSNGGYCAGYFTVDSSSVLKITVGAGGTGGAGESSTWPSGRMGVDGFVMIHV
eukprot:m.16490 g.16490  ORF g.16490 m.16490 type:complete len:261 (-) comp10543_c0_seq1:187-969(-)